jgi:hypothetical protein
VTLVVALAANQLRLLLEMDGKARLKLAGGKARLEVLEVKASHAGAPAARVALGQSRIMVLAPRAASLELQQSWALPEHPAAGLPASVELPPSANLPLLHCSEVGAYGRFSQEPRTPSSSCRWRAGCWRGCCMWPTRRW